MIAPSCLYKPHDNWSMNASMHPVCSISKTSVSGSDLTSMSSVVDVLSVSTVVETLSSTKSVSVLFNGLKSLGAVDTGFVFLILFKQVSHVLSCSPFLLIAKYFKSSSDRHLAHFLSSASATFYVYTYKSKSLNHNSNSTTKSADPFAIVIIIY